MCKKLLFLISFVSVLGMVGSAFATEWHVGPAGAINPVTGNPYVYNSIESAYNAVAFATQDIITIHAATPGGTAMYSMGAGTGTFKNNDSKQDITFRRYGTDNIRMTTHLETRYHTGWTVDGLNFSSMGDSYYGINFLSQANFLTKNWTIKNCIFYNVNSDVIYAYSTNVAAGHWNTTIENCTFYTNTTRDAIQMYNYCYDWTIKDCIFQNIKRWDQSTTKWNGYAVNNRTGNNVYADYCTFYNNGDAEMGNRAYYGTQAAKNTRVWFASEDPNSSMFLWLSNYNAASTLTGDSNGSYRGARPAPEPATVALLGLGALALLRRKR